MSDLPTSDASYLERYLEPFRSWLTRDDVTELAINPDGRVWIEVAGAPAMEPVDLVLDASAALNLAQSIVGDARARVSEKNPLVSGKIEFAGRPIRVQVVVAPAIERGASITMRMFAPATLRDYRPEFLFGAPISLDALRQERLREVAEMSRNDLDAALALVVESRLNILVSGGTSTGKTTFARFLLGKISPAERIVTIEDAFELFPAQPNRVSLLSERNAASQRSTNVLLQATLRMRPDRIVVGELRGPEALTYLEAINTGHGGSVTTIHAETAALAIDRLALMVLQAGTPLTFDEVKDYVMRSIDLVAQLGKAEGRRGLTELVVAGAGREWPGPQC